MTRRLLALVAVYLIALFAPLIAFLPAVAAYGLAYVGYELLILAVLIDAQFGFTMHGIPLYTVGALGTMLVVELVRPHLTINV